MRLRNSIRRLDVELTVTAVSKALVVAMFGFVAQGSAQTFSNTNAISINDLGTPPTVAALYPSSISVAGLDGQSLSHLTVTLYGFTHTYPSDLDILLVGPGGQASMLMSEVGGNTKFSVSDLTLTLDDSAATALPIDSTLLSGTFQPTRQFPTLSFDFPSPAPAGSSSAPAALSIFDGTNPSGTWNLFVVDESSPDSGIISGGWSMQMTTIPEPATAAFAILGLGCFAASRVRRRNLERSRS